MIKKTQTELVQQGTTGTTDQNELTNRSIDNVHKLISQCPNPTQSELRKLLSIQGYLLNTIGLEILQEFHGQRKNVRQMNLAVKVLAASKEALKAASAIDDLTETVNVSDA